MAILASLAPLAKYGILSLTSALALRDQTGMDFPV